MYGGGIGYNVNPSWIFELNAYNFKKNLNNSTFESILISAALLYQFPQILSCDPYIGLGIDLFTKQNKLGGHISTGFDYAIAGRVSLNAEFMYLKASKVNTTTANSYYYYDYYPQQIDPSGAYALAGLKYRF